MMPTTGSKATDSLRSEAATEEIGPVAEHRIKAQCICYIGLIITNNNNNNNNMGLCS